MNWSIPNILTIARIGMIPVIAALFYCPHDWAPWAALVIYALAAITDFFDGYLARSMKVESAFGRFLDPIADKLLVATILILLAGFDRLEGYWLIPAIAILLREILIAGLREFLGPANIQLPVSKLAKWKTTIQLVALGFLIVGPAGNAILPYSEDIGHWGLLAAAILTLITGYDYMKAGFKHIQQMDQKKPD